MVFVVRYVKTESKNGWFYFNKLDLYKKINVKEKTFKIYKKLNFKSLK